MNSLFAISARAAKIETEELSKADMLDLADMYSETRGLLATMFSYMAPESQARYTGFANALKDYEKKVTWLSRFDGDESYIQPHTPLA